MAEQTKEFIVDIEFRGNVLRLVLGHNDKFTGDQWNEPAADNGVYAEYVDRYCDVYINFEVDVLIPEEDKNNYFTGHPYSKNDFKYRMAPRCVLVPWEYTLGQPDPTYSEWCSSDIENVVPIYLGDTVDVIDEKFIKFKEYKEV